MTRSPFIMVATFLLLLIVMAPRGWAFSFELNRVADKNTPIPGGTGTFTDFGSPAISGSNVAFAANGSAQSGVYLFNGSALGPVADRATPIPEASGNFIAFSDPAVSGVNVAFWGFGASSYGVYLVDGVKLGRVADLNTPIPGGSGSFTGFAFFNGEPGLSLSGGNVAFQGGGSSGQWGIYLFEGVLKRVADRTTPIPGGSGNFISFGGAPPALSGANVAFAGAGSGFQLGIYLFDGSLLNRVADLNTPIPGGTGNFTGFERPAISGSNVAFRAFGSEQIGIYIFEGSVLKRVADLNTPIPGGSGNFIGDFREPVFSGENVVFQGAGSSGQGLYLFEDGQLKRVADSNTPVPGGSGNFVTFTLGSDWVLRGGNVAFIAEEGIYFSNGSALSRVVDRDTPIPAGSGNFFPFFADLAVDANSVVFQGYGYPDQAGIYVGTPIMPPAAQPKLVNISTRGQVGTGDDLMIGGLIIQGSTPKTVLLRARGPSMGGAPFFVPGVLANPLLTLFSGSTVIAQNDNWQDPPNCNDGLICGTAAQITATGLDPCVPNPGQSTSPPNCVFESAILITLPPGAYTAQLFGASGEVGVGLVEAFDIDGSTTAALHNISTRGLVGAGDQIMIGGFIITGSTPKTVLVRGRGPSLSDAPFFVPGALTDPFLRIFSGPMPIAENNNWQDTPSCSPPMTCGSPAQIAATGLDPCQPNPGQGTPPLNCAFESAILITLEPGAYTVQLMGAAGQPGVGLAEIFEIPF